MVNLFFGWAGILEQERRNKPLAKGMGPPVGYSPEAPPTPRGGGPVGDSGDYLVTKSFVLVSNGD